MKGSRSSRIDALDKVTGKAYFSSDYSSKNMLHAKVLFSPVPHAKIMKIDISEAEKAPGVFKIITRSSIHGPNKTGGLDFYDHPVLVGEGEECHFVNDALALIAARSEDEAARARDLIKVTYEELPCDYTVDEAKRTKKPSFVREIKKGNIEEGLQKAAVIVEETYHIPYQEHAYLETESGYAYVDYDDCVTVICGTQDVRANHKAVTTALKYPENKVRFHSPYVGGAFGGKHPLTIQPYLTLLAHELRWPVKLRWTREESLAFSCKKQSSKGVIRLGLDQEGHICALQGLIEEPSAPYFSNSLDNCFGAMVGMIGPYHLPNIDLTGHLYYTTGPELGPFRGVGVPDGVLLMESLLTKAGAKLGISQAEIRKRNCIKNNDEFKELVSPSLILNSADDWPMEKLIDMTLREAGPLKEAGPHKKTGRGIGIAQASFATKNTDFHSGSSVQIEMYLDGTVMVKSGFVEVGQGIVGVITKITGQELDIPDKNISVRLGDTHMTPPAGALGFSQATVSVGNSIITAANKLKHQLCELACELLETDEELHFSNYTFYNEQNKAVLDWKRFSNYCFAQVQHLIAWGSSRGKAETHNYYSVTPVVCVADVEIDEETGELEVLQILHCHDSGTVIQPTSARGQILGAAVMGMGGCLMEEFIMEKGKPKTPSLAEYIVPTAMDIPKENRVIFYENNKASDTPYGAKGMGEHGMYCTGAAINNAIFDAIGESILDIPVTPEKILRAMHKI